ncbi:phage tail tape measure protein [Pseudomonas frederiksbergensis]|uniref:Phage tail tape measure protein n=1 Tax=Pseudomonas frederiksbergensis TaxID=104087 RepID=A0A1J0ERI5_9PSED|nr:phage tail tape measure protein [Pseudomonas frederiksbergensis]APC18543.1 phage tail tape measure protein [Pseudomonas frederiksbergensis]
MANEVLVGLKIGATVAGSLSAAFGSAKSTVQQLGRATDGLTAKQKLIGTELAASLARGGTGVERLRRQYDQVGRAIDQLKVKQERLNTSLARGAQLKSERGELRGQALETLGTAAVVGAPVVQSFRQAIDFQDQTRDISITGGFDAEEEQRLSNVMRESALRWNQTQTEVANGTGVLIAGGISSAKELAAYAPVMAKAATATRASMENLGSVAIALNDNLGIGAAGFERSMNILAYAGKRGQFELADMAKWLPQLTPQLAALGITGERAVAEIGASLQIARKGAGSNDEAANNFKNFLSKITAPDTLKAFADAGIDLQDTMRGMISKGLTPMQAMMATITKYTSTKGPAAAAGFQRVMAMKDDQERQIALDRLNEAYKLGELFRDQQVLSFVRPALANQDEQASIQKGGMEAADQGVQDLDWAKRMGSPKEQLKALTIGLTDVGIGLGGILLPALLDITKAAIPLVRSFSAWTEENAGLVSGVFKVTAGIVALKLGFIALKYGANLGASALNGMGTTMSVLSGKTTLLNSALLSARLAPFITGVTGLTTALPGLSGAMIAFGGAIAATPIGWIIGGIVLIAALGLVIYKNWEPLKAWMIGFFTGLKDGLKPIGDAFSAAFAPVAPLLAKLGTFIKPVITWFRELFSPVQVTGDELGKATWSGIEFGRAVGAVLSGLLAPVRWLLEGIGEIPKAFDGGLAGVAALIVNFSPLGLFYKAFAGVMSYFGVELPGKFTEFGSMIIDGLVNGIKNKASAATDAVLELGSSIKSWFTGDLQIHSPSRVFMGYGANVSEGAALGITGQSDLVRKAALDMASQSRVNMAPPNPADVSMASMMGGGGMGGKIEVSFSPNITVPGGPGVMEQVNQGLQASYVEFLRMMERFEHERQRRSYGSTGGGRT